MFPMKEMSIFASNINQTNNITNNGIKNCIGTCTFRKRICTVWKETGWKRNQQRKGGLQQTDCWCKENIVKIQNAVRMGFLSDNCVLLFTTKLFLIHVIVFLVGMKTWTTSFWKMPFCNQTSCSVKTIALLKRWHLILSAHSLCQMTVSKTYRTQERK